MKKVKRVYRDILKLCHDPVKAEELKECRDIFDLCRDKCLRKPT